jgi:hypothetical protein
MRNVLPGKASIQLFPPNQRSGRPAAHDSAAEFSSLQNNPNQAVSAHTLRLWRQPHQNQS